MPLLRLVGRSALLSFVVLKPLAALSMMVMVVCEREHASCGAAGVGDGGVAGGAVDVGTAFTVVVLLALLERVW